MVAQYESTEKMNGPSKSTVNPTSSHQGGVP